MYVSYNVMITVAHILITYFQSEFPFQPLQKPSLSYHNPIDGSTVHYPVRQTGLLTLKSFVLGVMRQSQFVLCSFRMPKKGAGRYEWTSMRGSISSM